MIILAQSDLPVFTQQSSFLRKSARSSLFNNCRYVRYLNRMLHRERASALLFQLLMPALTNATGLPANHRESAKLLINLIIGNRGLPADPRPFWQMRVQFLTQILIVLPQAWRQFLCRQWQKYLFTRYRQVATIAPGRDLSTLRHLQTQAGRNEIHLRR